MLRFLFIALVILTISQKVCYAQESYFKPNGAFGGKIYANFNSSLIDDNPTTGFEVKRAYFGYKYNLTPLFSTALKLDIGSPDVISETTRINRYAYFKTAAAYYKNNNLTIGFGLTDTYQYKVQNKFWQRRYLYKNIAEGNNLGPSADIGLTLVKKWSKLTADIAFFNGEGYKELQNDNSFKAGAGLTFSPKDVWIIRAYADVINKYIAQTTYTIFIGFKKDKFRIGAEGVAKINEKYIKENNRFGFSTYGHFQIVKRLQVFGRYDYLESSIPKGDNIPWNLAKDGSAIVSGIEYLPINKIRLALNYQDWVPLAKNMDLESAIFLNLEVAF